MAMHPRVLRRLAITPLALCVCKPAAPPQPAIDTTIPAKVADHATPAAAEPETLPAPAIYGHVRIPSPIHLLDQVRDQMLPAAQRMMFNEAMLRSLIAMQLGERSAIAQNVDLTRPMGCVVTSAERHAQPVACVIAYSGGLEGLVEDLGAEGYISGGDGYASYRIDGQPVYLNAIDSHVAIAFAPDLTAATRDRLQRDIIGVAPGPEDLSGTVFPAVIFDDIPEQVEAFIERAATGNSGTHPLQQAQGESRRQQLRSYGDLERADVWLDVAPERVRVGYRGTARPETATAKAYEAERQIAPDDALVRSLPAESFAVGSMRFDPHSFSNDPVFGATIRALSSMDDSGAAAGLAEVYQQSMALWGEIFTGHAAVAMLHEKGTKGGVVISYRLRPGVEAAPKLREVFARMAGVEKDVLPIAITLEPRALRIGKTRGDLMTMRPAGELRAQLQARGSIETLERALGGPVQLQLAFAQQGDVLYMTFSLRDAKRYLTRVMAAGRGKDDLQHDAEAKARLTPLADASMYMLIDVRRTIEWLIAIDAVKRPPGPLGGQLDDVVLSLRPGGDRQREIWVDVSQDLVDDLVALGG